MYLCVTYCLLFVIHFRLVAPYLHIFCIVGGCTADSCLPLTYIFQFLVSAADTGGSSRLEVVRGGHHEWAPPNFNFVRRTVHGIMAFTRFFRFSNFFRCPKVLDSPAGAGSLKLNLKLVDRTTVRCGQLLWRTNFRTEKV